MKGIKFVCDKCGDSLTVIHYHCHADGCEGVMKPDINQTLVRRLIEDAEYWFSRRPLSYDQTEGAEQAEAHMKLIAELKTSLFA